jgi:Holliday junction resolvasome RuvABC ATP-dependent DNA helicase subunit
MHQSGAEGHNTLVSVGSVRPAPVRPADRPFSTVIRGEFAAASPPAATPFLMALARMSRLNPRTARTQAAAMMRRHRFDAGRYPLTLEGLSAMSAEEWRVDDNGLRDADRQYLRALAGSRRGVAALTQLLPVGREEIVNVIEPYLPRSVPCARPPAGAS